jgi:hypothetical protein
VGKAIDLQMTELTMNVKGGATAPLFLFLALPIAQVAAFLAVQHPHGLA